MSLRGQKHQATRFVVLQKVEKFSGFVEVVKFRLFEQTPFAAKNHLGILHGDGGLVDDLEHRLQNKVIFSKRVLQQGDLVHGHL